MRKPAIADALFALFMIVWIAAIVCLPGCRMIYNKCEVNYDIAVPKGAGDLKSLSITNNIYSDSDATLAADKATPFDLLRGINQGGAISAAPGAASTQSGVVTATTETTTAVAKPVAKPPKAGTPNKEVRLPTGALALPSAAGQ